MLRQRRSVQLSLVASQFKLQAPTVLGLERLAPEFERPHLREAGCQLHAQFDLARLLAEAQQGDERGVAMDLLIVENRDFAVRVVTSRRAIEREMTRAGS